MIDPVDTLEQRLGHVFADRARALAALTHKSWVNEHRGVEQGDNERLEFLGDAVIDLAISHRLMERFPNAREGELSRLRAQMVHEGGLALVAAQLELGELLRLGRGEELTGGRKKPSLLADALEAVVAALYLEGGLPLVLSFVDRFFGAELARVGEASSDRDWKTQAQELAQGVLHATPRYRVVHEVGPDHEKTFVVEALLRGRSIGRGEGRSKKEAEQLAARAALAAIPGLAATTEAPAEEGDSTGAPRPEPSQP